MTNGTAISVRKHFASSLVPAQQEQPDAQPNRSRRASFFSRFKLPRKIPQNRELGVVRSDRRANLLNLVRTKGPVG